MQENRGLGYLLPNILTSGTLFAGFYSIVAAMNGHFRIAALSVFAAIVMDLLDGRVARLTNTQSEFGAHYDSLADLVAFGVAPALIAYSWGLHELSKIGWLIAFIYVATGALRLARFNTMKDEPESQLFFTGIPIPAAAAIVASFTDILMEFALPTPLFTILLAIVTVSVSALMVSNVRYYNFKHVEMRGKTPFIGGILVLIILVAISIEPITVICVASILYALSGLLLEVIRRYRKYGKIN